MSYDYHKPVLVEKVLEFLMVKPDGVYVDATLGGGGHTERILEKLSPTGVLIGIDTDMDAVEYSKKRFGEKIFIFHSNFSHLPEILSLKNILSIDGILFDLGISSFQIDNPQKGFSFSKNGVLDMRFDKRQKIDARYIVNNYSEFDLASIIYKYGEERHSRKIAKKIVNERVINPINTTSELSSIIESVVGKKFLNKTLARVFQALRIEVNQELETLRKTLETSIELLNTSGRIVVISYHSLEDRIVKNIFKMLSQKKMLNILTKKPVIPDFTEVLENPRSRSAKLRAAEKL